MEKFELWEKKARNEFKYGEFYSKDIGEDFEVLEDGTVDVKGGKMVKRAVTSYKEFIIN